MEKSYSESLKVDQILREKLGCLLDCVEIERELDDIGTLLQGPIMPWVSDRPFVYKIRPSPRGEAELKKYYQAVQMLYLVNKDRLRLREQHLRLSCMLDSASFSEEERERFYTETTRKPIQSMIASLQSELLKQRILEEEYSKVCNRNHCISDSKTDASTDTTDLNVKLPPKKQKSAVFINRKLLDRKSSIAQI